MASNISATVVTACRSRNHRIPLRHPA